MFLTKICLQAYSLLSLLPPPISAAPSPANILHLPTLLLPPSLNTTTRPHHLLPPVPFALPIPLTHPPQTLKVLSQYRAGLSTEKYALLDLIDESVEWYYDHPPQNFTLSTANVRFEMRVAKGTEGGEGALTSSVVVATLQVLNALVEEFGAVECDFVVEGEGEVKARFGVRFF